MAQLTEIQKMMLQKVADMKAVPEEGAFNLRLNGKGFVRHSSEHIDIVPKEDKPGIDIYIKEGTQGETVAIPVVITESGMDDLVYNDFHIADGVDVNIVAGCGIHNCGCEDSRHNGIHTFYVGKNAKVRYSEKHYGAGDGTGGRILNPQTILYIGEGSTVFLDMSQIGGVEDPAEGRVLFCGKDKLGVGSDGVMEALALGQSRTGGDRLSQRKVVDTDAQNISFQMDAS